MCGGCISNLDAAAMGAGGLLVTARGAWHRLTTRSPSASAARRATAWDDTADLLRRLDQDPVEVLGPRPEIPDAGRAAPEPALR